MAVKSEHWNEGI